MLNSKQCQAIRERAKATKEGPWPDRFRAITKFQVQNRTDVPALLDTVDELRAIIKLIDDNIRRTDIMLISDDAEERIRKALPCPSRE